MDISTQQRESKGRVNMEALNKFYKNDPSNVIWWVNNPEKVGEWLFSFDKQKVFNMFRDYPHELNAEQKAIFDEENPYWADFFKDRATE